LSSETCKYTHFFTINLALTNKLWAMEKKLLTHLNSALKVLLGLDIFSRVPKKKLNFVDQCYQWRLVFRVRSDVHDALYGKKKLLL